MEAAQQAREKANAAAKAQSEALAKARAAANIAGPSGSSSTAVISTNPTTDNVEIVDSDDDVL